MDSSCNKWIKGKTIKYNSNLKPKVLDDCEVRLHGLMHNINNMII